jgi:putative DNA methylase
MSYRKKLIEVALPLKAINEASAREKSIRHGHPSTLHLWWARRPLAACRAVLFASLVDDPDSDPMYAGAGEEIAGQKRAELFNLIEELVLWENSNNPRVINRARAEIARSVAANKVADGEWTNDTLLELSCGAGVPPAETCGVAVPAAETCGVAVPAAKSAKSSEKKTAGETPAPQAEKADQAGGTPAPQRVSVRDIKNMLAPPEAVNAFLAEYAPPVLDPFCGGGSIPLEAQRLGLRAFGSDLNPVPVLITKSLIEIPSRFAALPPINPEWDEKSAEEKAAKPWEGAQGLAEDVRYYGNCIRKKAEKCIGHLYPKVRITAEMAEERLDLQEYVGKELTPIAWLWARTIDCPNPACGCKTPIAKTFELSGKKGNEAHIEPIIETNGSRVTFRVVRGRNAPREGNVSRRGADCLLCGAAILLDHIRSEASAGRMGQQMMAVIAEGRRNRVYVSPSPEQIAAAESARAIDGWSPATTLPDQALGFRVQRYGMTTHAALFSHRQLVALSTFANLVREILDTTATGPSSPAEYRTAVATYLAFALSKAANYWSSLCSWYVNLEKMVSTFGLPTLSMVWDFAEANPFSDSSGNWMLGVEQAASVLDELFADVVGGEASQLDATQHPMPFSSPPIISTDPPYYDNIGYANLSDFFYVWLRRCLASAYPTLFSTMLTPKDAELIAEPGRFDNDRDEAVRHFEQGATRAFARLRAGADPRQPMTIFYAFKQQETSEIDDGLECSVVSSGWEKMLSSLITVGCSIQGTWPIRTEQSGGLREAQRNALASSIVLVCRPRPDDAPLARRKDFMNALRGELPDALRNLQHGNIAPVDLAQAAIGPGMAVFTRYAKVVEADGSAMSVRTALGIINQVLDEVLAEQEGEFDPDTRWALAWFAEHGMHEGPFGIAEILSKAKVTSVAGLVEAGVVKARGGKVKLVGRDELPDNWDPGADGRLTVWETTQHLIRALETQGESGAAALLARLGGIGETARELAYRLYTLCERKKWADEALAYNGLVIAWPELSRLALARRNADDTVQKEIFK